jgi:hypothetical protein
MYENSPVRWLETFEVIAAGKSEVGRLESSHSLH